MRLRPSPLLFGMASMGALAAAQVVGCGGGSSTTQASGTTGSPTTTGTGASATSTGSGGTTTTTTGSGGGGGATPAVCGDGKVEGSEQCDLGMANGTMMGCKADCTFDCATAADCNKGMSPCAGTATCVAATVQGEAVMQCMAGTALASGASCGTNLFCVGGNCVAPTCGDGVVESPEECDDGNTTNGDGCESDCKFTCLATDPTRDCASANACVSSGTCGTNHVCTAGSNVTNGTSCTAGTTAGTCQNGVCALTSCTGATACAVCATGGTTGFCDGSPLACNASTCGDGCVDASKGEQCDPPNGTTCDASCHTVMTAVCGNGTLEAGEQCDDGNLFDLDGCDSHCKYETVARMTTVAISGSKAPAFCTPATNRLGAQSIGGATPLGQLNGPLQDDVTNGTVNVFMQFLNLSDLTGVAASNFSIGVLDGSLDPAKGACATGGCAIDWWFFADHTAVSMGLPTGLFTTTQLSARTLTAGPNNVTLSLLLGGSPAVLTMLNAHVSATINGTPAPDKPAPPPTQLEAGLTVFQTITGNGTGQGLCGNITVDSLAKIPIPATLAQGGTAACSTCANSHVYTGCGTGMTPGVDCNSLLDVLVGGCGVVPVFGSCLVAAVNPLQPDVPTNSGGTVKTLVPGANNIIPPASTTGDDDAYSAYLTFAATRAHFTGETCLVTTDCQTGKTCTGGVCK